MFSSGGIGVLEPRNLDGEDRERHPDAAVLVPAETHLSLAIDYFDIKVKGEVSQLGAQNIIFGCYDSSEFPE